MLPHRALQLSVGQVLQLAIDGQCHVTAFDRYPQVLNVFDHPPESVLDHAPAAGPARQPVLVLELDTLLPAVIYIGDADELGGYLTGGVVTAIFAPQRNTRQSELHDLGCQLRGELALEVDELATGLG